MRFEFVRCETLPKLAWCAHVRRGAGAARIFHGPWVETRGDWFVEGAWTGPFDKGEIDTALFNLGSGGCARAGRAVFCTQTDMIDRLYSLRAGGDLFLSNSLTFVLAMAGDEPDPDYPFYCNRVRGYFCDGIRRKHKAIRTRRGNKVWLHDHCQVAVSDDLRLMRIEKPAFPQPATFADYVSMLKGVLQSVLENAAHPERRRRRYTGLATVSGGYDSNALAALLSQLGVREAMTFYDRVPGNDSGEEVARCLGMKVRAYERMDFRALPDLCEAEFLSSPDKGSDIVMAACEEQLTGKILVTGRYGDAVFGDEDPAAHDDFQLPLSHGIGGSRMLEFRLRVGFLNFNPYYAGGLHLPAIHAIAMSDEMAPWRMGGNYDRPLPRRILEEAGVPRGTFGVRKAATAHYGFHSTAQLSPAARSDFESYRRSMPRPGPLRRGWHRGLVKLRSECERITGMIQSYWWSGGTLAQSMIPVPWRYQPYDELDFAVHWAQAHVRKRYAEAVTACGRAN